MLQFIGWIIVIWLFTSAIFWIIDDIKTYILLGDPVGVEKISAKRQQKEFFDISSEEEAYDKGKEFADEIIFRDRNLLRKLSLQVAKIGIAIYLIYILQPLH